MIVADANLLINFVCATEHAHLARQVREKDPDWMSPGLWRAEVLNGLLVMHRAGLLSVEDATKAWHNAAAATVVGLAQENPAEILRAARAATLSAYDAYYVCMARALKVRLVTEDKRILRACPDVACSMQAFVKPQPDSPAVQERCAVDAL